MRIPFIWALLSILCASFSAWGEEPAKGREPAGGNPEELRRKLMAKFDLNGDGQVDEFERAQVAEQMKKDFAAGKLDPKDLAMAREIMARMQGQGGGAPQFGAPGFGGPGFGGPGFGAPGASGFSGDVPADVIARFDKNRDGELDEKEQKAAMAAMSPKKSRSQQLKEKLDLNGDGKITKEERKAYAEERKAEQEEKKKDKGKKKDADERE
jgi:hypothetical protein